MIKVFSVLVVLFVSFQLNAQWVSQQPGVTSDFVAISAIDSLTCWFAGFEGNVTHTTNGGTTWLNNGQYADISSIYALDANTCLASTYSQGGTSVFKTTDGGYFWTQVFSQAHVSVTGFEGIRAIYMTSATNGFMVGDPVNLRWSLWKTTDGGSTWDSTGLYLMAANSSERAFFHCLYIDGSNIWFGAGNSKIYHSIDYGITWSTQNTNSLTNVCDVWFSGTTGIAAGYSGNNFEGPGVVYLSSNSGVTWTQTPNPGLGNIIAATTQGSNFIYSTLFGAIYLSTDRGISFSKVDSVSDTGHVYFDLRIARNDNSVWACGPGGRIRKGTINKGATGVNDNISSPFAYSLNQNYPNPFNPSTVIKYAVPFESKVNIRFYNSLGQTVREVNEGSRQPGNYKINFNSSGLASGIYLYSLKAVSSDGKNDFTAVKKMILLK
jgi:photosystem II stability/assembly factor-like uncharacterized protein